MAKILVEIDTEANTTSVSIDGSMIEGVSSFHCYNDGCYSKMPYVSIELVDEVAGLRRSTYISNSEIKNSKPTDFKGFYSSLVDPKTASAVSKVLFHR